MGIQGLGFSFKSYLSQLATWQISFLLFSAFTCLVIIFFFWKCYLLEVCGNNTTQWVSVTHNLWIQKWNWNCLLSVNQRRRNHRVYFLGCGCWGFCDHSNNLSLLLLREMKAALCHQVLFLSGMFFSLSSALAWRPERYWEGFRIMVE